MLLRARWRSINMRRRGNLHLTSLTSGGDIEDKVGSNFQERGSARSRREISMPSTKPPSSRPSAPAGMIRLFGGFIFKRMPTSWRQMLIVIHDLLLSMLSLPVALLLRLDMDDISPVQSNVILWGM